MAITRRPVKPYRPIMARGNPQAQGLLFWAPCGNLTVAMDLAQGRTIPYIAGTTNVKTPFGLAMSAATDNFGARGASPAALNGLLPVSLMVVFYQVSAPDDNAVWFGVKYASSSIDPYNQYAIAYYAASINAIGAAYNTAGTAVFLPVATTGSSYPSVNNLHVLILTLATGAQNIYLDGVNIATAAAAESAPTSSSPQIVIGIDVDTPSTTNCGAYILDTRIYNRALTAYDARSFTDTWDALYLRQSAIMAKRRAAAGVIPQIMNSYRQRRVNA